MTHCGEQRRWWTTDTSEEAGEGGGKQGKGGSAATGHGAATGAGPLRHHRCLGLPGDLAHPRTAVVPPRWRPDRQAVARAAPHQAAPCVPRAGRGPRGKAAAQQYGRGKGGGGAGGGSIE